MRLLCVAVDEGIDCTLCKIGFLCIFHSFVNIRVVKLDSSFLPLLLGNVWFCCILVMSCSYVQLFGWTLPWYFCHFNYLGVEDKREGYLDSLDSSDRRIRSAYALATTTAHEEPAARIRGFALEEVWLRAREFLAILLFKALSFLLRHGRGFGGYRLLQRKCGRRRRRQPAQSWTCKVPNLLAFPFKADGLNAESAAFPIADSSDPLHPT